MSRKTLNATQSVDRIDLRLTRGHDPKDFVDQHDSALRRSCLRCSATDVSSALRGETTEDAVAHTVDCYHVATPNGDVTVKLFYPRESYGLIFKVVSISNDSCRSPRVSSSRVEPPREADFFIKQPYVLTSVLGHIPRAELDECMKVSRRWRNAITSNGESLPRHHLRSFKIDEDRSTTSGYVLPGKRCLIRSSRLTTFDPMRNALVEHLEVNAKNDDVYPAIFDFLGRCSVTARKASLSLPAFYSTDGVRLIATNQLLVGSILERLSIEQLSLTFDEEERGFSLIGLQHSEQLQVIEITTHELPWLEIERLVFGARTAIVHLTLLSPARSQHLATFLDDFLTKCSREGLVEVVAVRAVLANESVGYPPPPLLRYVETVGTKDSRIPEGFARHLRCVGSEECLIYLLCREDQPDYTVVLSWEPISPHTGNRPSLRLIVFPEKLTLSDK